MSEEQFSPPIKGLIETSFLDWKGKMCSTIFLANCNFRCPFCHNYELVLTPNKLQTWPFSEVINKLKGLKPWIDAVCITGGEPTCYEDIKELIKLLKDEGFLVKLDTNGYRPSVLKELLDEGLLDFISMDVKTVLDEEKYSICVGKKIDIERIKTSIELIKKSGIEHEFRMTVLPRLHPPDLIRDWAKALKGDNSKLTIQRFSPERTLDPAFSKEIPYDEKEFNELKKEVRAIELEDISNQEKEGFSIFSAKSGSSLLS